ncbi:spore germination protein GerPE [Bacillus sp. REN3]|uniref:spore germination protein GerPE n=1 Tax=Bacillus sp. REN3 TaxID=2802440 RepID=UPI001FF033BD|nr:spore germination protein GerPE [Bacillus sp. REN3]
MVLQRTSCVDHLKIDAVTFSSICQIGDSVQICGFSRALAVQREADVFFGNEGHFANYPIFSEEIPLLPITERFASFTHNLNPLIKVKNVDIIGVSASSVVHIGNSCQICMEARVKHIRQLLPREEQND